MTEKTHFANKNGEEIFKMGAPVMFDATGEQSMEIDVVISEVNAEKNSFTYTLVPDMEWISSAEREYPLSIDPDICVNFESNVKDTHISKKNPNTKYDSDSRIKVGGEPYYHALIKIMSLPVLSSGDVVVQATLNLTVRDTGSSSFCEEIDLHKVTDVWNAENVTWNTFYQPTVQPTIEPPADFERVESLITSNYNGYLNVFDITSLVKSWYIDPTANEGVLLKYKPSDEAKDDDERPYTDFSSSIANQESDRHPYFSIIYINSTGLEDRFTYNSHSLGRAGTGYVNVYSGNLTFVHDDATLNNGTMPITVSHVYNTNYKDQNIGYGNGWRLNYAQSIEKVQVQNRSGTKTYYKWTDGDGTAHYYVADGDSTTKYVNELDKNSTLTASGTTITIKDKGDNELIFYSNSDLNYGRLRVMRDANGNEIRIEYVDGVLTNYRVLSVTEKFAGSSNVGSSITFEYNAAGNLEKIKPLDGINLEYKYTSNNLTEIVYPDSRIVKYTYSNNCLTKAKNINNYAVLYEYSTEENSTDQNKRATYRVSQVHEQVEAGTTPSPGQSVSYEYTVNTTKVTDNQERNTIYQFNTSGQPVSVRDAEGRAVYAAYSKAERMTTELSAVSKMQTTVFNLIKNHDIEYGLNDWETESGTRAATANISSSSYTGKTCAKLPAGLGTYIKQALNVEAGKTYTFSAYVYGGTGAKVNLQVYNGDTLLKETGEIEPAKIGVNTWVRGSVTFEVPESCTSVTLKAITASSRAAYVDALQLEEGATPNRYNMIHNGDFSEAMYCWNESSKIGDTADDGIVTLDTTEDDLHPLEFSDYVYHIEGEALNAKYIYQDIPVSGKLGDTYSFGAWLKTDSVAKTIQLFDDAEDGIIGAEYGVKRVTLQFLNGTASVGEATMLYGDATTTDWQYVCGSAVAAGTYNKIRISLNFHRTRNDCYFDGIQLHKEEFSQAYTYDGNGNLTSYTSLLDLGPQEDKKDGVFTYDESTNDLLSAKDARDNITTYTYDNNHNMLTSTTPEEIITSNTYNDRGQITKTNVGSENAYTQARYEYNDYGLTTKVTDTFGQSATTVYDASKRKATSTTDARGNTTTYTLSGANNLNRVTKIASGGSEVLYTYAYDFLTSIDSYSVIYNFGYSNFGNLTNFSITTPASTKLTLMTNSYDNEKGLQTRRTYSNGLTVRYTYDDYDNVTQVKYGSYATYNYTYDKEGNLYSASDSLLGRTTYYEYDHAGRCMASITKNTAGEVLSAYRYQYDRNNNLTNLANTTGSNKWTTTYAYDKDNRPVSATLENGTVITNTYDEVGRLTTKTIDAASDYAVTMTYFAGANDASSTDGEIVTQSARLKSYQNGNHGSYSYQYDANGNISRILTNGKTIEYEYDSLNRIIEEDNAVTDELWTYEYDANGNIVEKTKSIYNEDTYEFELEEVITYDYVGTGSSGWYDQLSSYNGESIVYDSIGNPTTYRGYNMAWQGRRLTSASKSGTNVTYAYDENGIRTRKTVNGTATNYYYHGSTLISLERGSDTLLFSYDSNGQVAAVKYGGNYYYYLYNGQGDVVAIMDSNYATVVQYSYDIWGKLLSTTGSKATTLGVLNPFRYRGYVYDEETKLYYLNSRYYDPETCRFISADEYSVLLASTNTLTDKNLYAYCDNNPVVRADNEGDFWHIVAGAAIGGVISGLTKIASNVCQGEKWSSGLGIAVLSGAASGALAATGVCAVGAIAVNAAIAMTENTVEQVVENKGFKNFDFGDMLFDGAVGAVSGTIGGPGKGTKHLMSLGKQTVRRTVNAFTHKGAKAGFKEMGKAFVYYGKNSKYFYRGLVKGLPKDIGVDIGTSVVTSDYAKNYYRRWVVK